MKYGHNVARHEESIRNGARCDSRTSHCDSAISHPNPSIYGK